MQVIKTNQSVSLERATKGSAGIDTQASISEDVVIYPGETKVIPLGFKMHIDHSGYAALLLPRSGLGKKGVVLANTIGLIDSDYQGEVMAALKNTGAEPFIVTPLMRICQLIFVPVWHPSLEVVTEFTSETVRGEGGFGSTGTTAPQATFGANL